MSSLEVIVVVIWHNMFTCLDATPLKGPDRELPTYDTSKREER